jgi:hypothetical protein
MNHRQKFLLLCGGIDGFAYFNYLIDDLIDRLQHMNDSIDSYGVDNHELRIIADDIINSGFDKNIDELVEIVKHIKDLVEGI